MRKYYIHLKLGLLLLVPLALGQCKRQPSDIEWPPSLSAAVDRAETVPYCELVRNPARFNNVMVRTEAMYYKNLENSVFRGLNCTDELVWVEFDPAYEYSRQEIKERFTELACLKQARCQGQARVVAVGKLEGPNQAGFGHLDCCPYRFSVVRLEKAEPAPYLTSSKEQP